MRRNVMWVVAAGLLLTVCGASGQTKPATQRQPRGLPGVGLTAEQVNRAIDKGAEFLWNFIKEEDFKKSNRKLGDEREHDLAFLALVHAGAHKRFPDFDATLRKFLAGSEVQNHTYQDGLRCMLIESYGDPEFLPKLRQHARYLLEAQGEKGSWDYGRRIPATAMGETRQATALAVTGGTPLDGTEAGGEAWARRTDWKVGGDGDTSNMQYAALGLQAAARCGIRFPADMWQRTLAANRQRQAEDGGFGYNGPSGSYGSMTAAGVCAIAICRAELGEKDPTADPAIEKGVAWMDKHFAVNKNPQASSWTYYWLYSAERAGRILDTEFLGAREWYPLGARYLVDAQRADGAWVGEGEERDPRLAGGFALLFLTRATPTLKMELKRGGSGLLKTAATAPPARLYIILDASGSMLEEMDGTQKFHIARDAVAALVKQLPPNAEVALRVYGHRRSALDEGADEDTELLIPMAPLKQDVVLKKLNTLRARGKTPLALSLTDAARDVGRADEKNAITVLLLTDGGEDTRPRKDPVKAAAAFAKIEGVKLHIIGFDISREDWAEQLQAMARAAGATYWAAAKAEVLNRQLQAAVLGLPDAFVVADKDGREVARGTFGESVKLPEGKYVLKTTYVGKQFERPLWINTDSMTAVTFDGAVAAAQAGGAPAPATQAATQPAPQPAAAKRFCTQCGAELAAAAKFCTQCGAKVGN